MEREKPMNSFIVLETKVVFGTIYIYGGLLPTNNEHQRETVSYFAWYELKHHRVEPEGK